MKHRNQFDDGNRAAAEVILSAPAMYGGEGALLVQWAGAVLAAERRKEKTEAGLSAYQPPYPGGPAVWTRPKPRAKFHENSNLSSQASVRKLADKTEAMNLREAYKLDCNRCGKTVELPAGAPRASERLRCPRCGARLQIDWRGVGAWESEGATATPPLFTGAGS